MNRLELDANHRLPHSEWTVSRAERDRYVRMLKKWIADNPKASLEAQCLADSYIWLHILEHRLRSNALFFDGTPTTFSAGAMTPEDIDRKTSELREWLPVIGKQKLELLKLAMASNVSLNITGDVGSVQSLFAARDKLAKGMNASGSNT